MRVKQLRPIFVGKMLQSKAQTSAGQTGKPTLFVPWPSIKVVSALLKCHLHRSRFVCAEHGTCREAPRLVRAEHGTCRDAPIEQRFQTLAALFHRCDYANRVDLVASSVVSQMTCSSYPDT